MASRSELIYDPIGHLFDGVYGAGAYGGHTDHVHVALARHPRLLLSLLLWARNHGLHVGENPMFDPVDPVHTEGSFHYQNFGRRFHGQTLGKAADVSGSAGQMEHFFNLARRRLESGNPIMRALANAGYGAGGGSRGGGGGRGGGGPAVAQPISIAPAAPLTSPADIFQRLYQPDAIAAPGLPNPAQAQSTYLASQLQDLRRQLLAT